MDAYIYNAAVYCSTCGQATIRDIEQTPALIVSREDSNHYPQGPYSDGSGECDYPQHCDGCGVFLENPLTGDGENYVREAWEENPSSPVVQQWARYYDYLNMIGDEYAA